MPCRSVGFLALSALAFPLAAATELYVAADGSDRNPGTRAKPFLTLTRARDSVRRLDKATAGPITVWVGGGTYYLASPIVFEPQDSGSSANPITYSASAGDEPVLSGGRKLVCEWKRYRNGIFSCSRPEAKQGRFVFTQLFVNGKRQILARYPNYDPSVPGKSGYTHAAGEETSPSRTERQFHYDPAAFTRKRWNRPSEAVLHIFPQNYWGNLQFEVKDIDWSRHLIRLGRGGFQLNELLGSSWFKPKWIGPSSRFFVENVFEELDSPGEWCLDRREGVLYYQPPSGVDLSNARVEVVLLKQLIEFRGSQRDPVHHIRLRGFRVTETATTFLDDYEAPSLGDWTIHRGGAIFLEGGEDNAIENCFFDAVGGNAIFLNNYNRRTRIYGNKFTEAGDSAICLVGSRHFLLGTEEPYPAQNLISNNLIRDIGVFGKQTAGVFVSISGENTVSHNVIYNVPRAAICINDGWYGGHTIEYNDIWNTVRETSDHGPFNSWGREKYWCLQQSHGPVSHGAGDVKSDAIDATIIRHNRFRDEHGWGIDLDDGSSNILVSGNLCIGISVKLREGDYRTVENNIFFHPANPPGFHVGYENNHDRFLHNIIVMSTKADRPELDVNFTKGKAEGDIYQVIYPPARGPIMQEIDGNVFFSDTGRFTASVITRGPNSQKIRYSLDEWRSLGFDRDSIFADPLFRDPATGDYSLRPDSPALKLGFRPFDLSTVGLLPDFPKQWRE